MIRTRILLLFILIMLALGPSAGATCPDACVGGGGSPKTDCLVEFAGVRPAAGKRLVCEDGDPSCDTDGVANGSCRFLVQVCFNVSDPALPKCSPSDVAAFEVRNPEPGKRGHDPQLAALAAAAPALPTDATVCTEAVPV